MPRKVDPGQIAVGKGLAPEGTVEDNSFRYPERDADPLRVHIHDPSRAHMASSIGIVDEADCYISDEVEGALQELCGGYSAGRLNGLIRGGLFNEVKAGLPTGGTTLTLETTTEIAIGGHVFDASGLTITLPTGANDYFVYCDTYSGSPDYRTLQYTTGAPPQVESDSPEIEHVMLAKITVAGGVITAYQDARFFVRNLDRKVLYSSRQGENVDAWSEGCFATLNAAMFWMEFYGDTGTSEEEKGTILVRGLHELEATLVVPSEHVEFVGDGEGIIRAKAGFVGSQLIEIPNAVDGGHVSFRNITFQTDVAGIQGIYADGVGDLGKVRIDSCLFDIYNAKTFTKAIVLRSTGPHGVTQFWMNNTIVNATITGLELRQPRRAEVLGCTFVGPGSAAAGIQGIWAWEGQNLVISGCTMEDWSDGIFLAQSLTDVRIETTRIEKCANGIKYDAGGIGQDIQISDCVIELDDNDAVAGIWMDDVKRVGISNTHIRAIRNNWGGGFNPYGIVVGALTGVPASAATQLDLQITGCYIEGFLNEADPDLGKGIYVAGTPTAWAVNTTITGNVLNGNTLTVYYAENTTITGNTFDGPSVGPSAAPLINLVGASHSTITGNTVRGRGKSTTGIYVGEFLADNTPSTNVTISGNTIQATTLAGIELENTVSDFTVSDNTIDLFLAGDPAAYGGALIVLSNSTTVNPPSRGTITGNTGYRAQNGILARGEETNEGSHLLIAHNVMANIANDAALVADSFSGSIGIGIEWYKKCTIQGNKLDGIGASPGLALTDVHPRPILAVDCEVLTIESNMSTGCITQGVGEAESISVYTVNDTVGIERSNFNIVGNVLQTGALTDSFGINFLVKRLVGDSPMRVRNVLIADNTITRVGGNLVEGIRVGLFSCADMFDLTVRDNIVNHYLLSGIDIQIIADAVVGFVMLDSFRVVGNTLHGADPGDSYTQRCLWVKADSSATAACAVVDGSVSSNKIIGGFDFGVYLDFNGLGGVGTELAAANIYVNDNEISELELSVGQPYTNGIYVRGTGARNAWWPSGLINFQISRNTMRNWNLGTLSQGIRWITGGMPVNILNVDNNVIVGEGTDSYPAIVYFSADATSEASVGAWTQVSISGNEIISSKSGSVRDVVVMDFADFQLEKLKVVSNTLQATGVVNRDGYGLIVRSEYKNSSDNSVSDVIVDGNAMVGGVLFHNSGASLSDCSVSNNHITCVSADTGHNPVRFDMDGFGVQPVLFGIQVQGNTLIGGATGCLIKPVSSVQYVKDVAIKDNIISGGFYSAFYLDASNASAVGEIRSLSVSGNQIYTTPRGIMAHVYEATIAGLTIRDNELREMGEQGIVCLLGGDSATDSAANVLIDGNTIFNVTATSGEPVIELGMHVPAPGNPGDAKNFSVSRNTIAQVGPRDNGLTYIFVDAAGWDNSHNVRICDNNLMGDPNEKDGMNTGIYVAVAPVNFNTHVDRNQIQAASRKGIYMASGGDSRVWSVSNNNVTNISDSVQHGVHIEVSGDHIEQWRVNDNVVRHVPASAGLSSTEGIFVKQTGQAGQWVEGSISRNNIDNYGYGIRADADNPTAFMKQMAVDDNLIGGHRTVSDQNVIEAMMYGIHIVATEFLFLIPTLPISGESILGLSVCRNQINSPAIGTNNDPGSGVLVVGGFLANSEVCRMVNISDNKVYQTDTSYDTKSSGIITYFLADNNVSEISVDRNQIRNISEYGVFTIGRCAWDNASACSLWSVSGNQVQASASFMTDIADNDEPFCNIGIAFPGAQGNESTVKDVRVVGNQSVVYLAGEHCNYYFGLAKDDLPGPSTGWWVCDNDARGGTLTYSVVTDGKCGQNAAWPLVNTWAGVGEPTHKTVHDNRCEDTGNDDNWLAGVSWQGATADNTHHNSNY